MAAVKDSFGVEVTPHLEDPWSYAQGLPCQLSAEVKVPHFQVRDLLRLNIGTLVDTQHLDGAHVPIFVNSVMIGWAEFDALEDRLAVRLTELF
jgi:flagellar motor switch protein FliN